jgi:2-phosphosulfolactate phosphatase
MDGHHLRPAFEDLVGAGAIISQLGGSRSPEAETTAFVFDSAADRLMQFLPTCSSGRELIDRGFAEDVELAAALDSETVVPKLIESAFVNVH